MRFRQLMPIPQHDDCTLAVRQPTQGPDQPVSVGYLFVDQIRHGRRLELRGQLFSPLAAARPAPLIPRRVDDAAPRIWQRVIDPWPPQVQPCQRLLRRVLGPPAVTAEHVGKSDKRITMRTNELVERGLGVPAHGHLRNLIRFSPLARRPGRAWLSAGQ